MADIKFAEVYACSEHFFVKNNTSLLAPYPVPTLSRNFVRYTDIRDFQQKNNGSSAAETGELYIIFDNGDSPFDKLELGAYPATGDTIVIHFYPMGSTSTTLPQIINNNKDFYEKILLAAGADNQAISFVP